MKSAVLLAVCFVAFCAIKESGAISWTTGKAYAYVSTKKSYTDAMKYCNSIRGYLAQPMNKAENVMVANLAGGKAAYIGFTDTDTEGSWKSSYGYKMCYSDWYSGEPNNAGNEDCAEINFRESRKWNDVPCTHSLPFVCEKYY